MDKKTMIVDGVEYVRKDAVSNQPAKSLKGLPYMLVRSRGAGVFAGYLKKRNGQECELLNARRIWYWDGAASLSQLAMEGVSKPENCKFPCEVDSIVILEVLELIPI